VSLKKNSFLRINKIGDQKISTAKKSRIRANDAITAQVVRLVDPEGILEKKIHLLGPGQHIGVMSRRDAQRKAEILGMDLVEVSPNAEPPVVRVMNYGKVLFDEKKTKKKQRVQKLKEVKLRPVTEEGDYQVKLRNLIGFLTNGDKVKVTIRFKGREITHKELGIRLLERIKIDIAGHGIIDQDGRLEGRQMVMMISPKK
jgi:translation initiation factor IF-3